MSVINTNVKSLVAADALRAGNTNLATAMERLSTGKKINSAKDDAAGLAIGTRMDSQVRGLNMAIKNANDGINLAQTAEGAMTEVTDMLQRMRELAVQAGNSTNTDTDRSAMNDEVTQLKSEIDRISKTTQFNGMNILDGSFAGKLQIGNNASQTMGISIGAVGTDAMGETKAGLSVSAAKAKLIVGGASQNVADYQGASFNVNVDGVNKTVTLPVSKPTTVQAGGATAALTPSVTDAVVDVSSKGLVGAFAENTTNLSVSTDAKIKLSVNGSADQLIDISDSKYYVDNTKVTGDEVVKALQTELNKNNAFQGANAVTVSLSSDGHVSLAMANGSVGTLKVTDTTGAAALAHKLGVTSNTSVSSTTGVLTINGTTKDFSANTAFAIGGNNLDLGASITSHGYDATKLTVDQFVTVFNDTANVNGVQLSKASTDTDGGLYFTSVPVKSTALNANGDLTKAASPGLGIAVNTNKSAVFADPLGTFGEFKSTIGSTSDTLTVGVNGGAKVNLKLDDGDYFTMGDMAAQIQKKLDTAFTGSDAVHVAAVKDATNNKWSLSFSNQSGEPIDLSGNFLTAASVNASGAATFFATSPYASNVISDAANHELTLHGNDAPASVGTAAFTVRTVDLTGATTANVSVNGSTVPANVDIAKSITKLGYKVASLTGDQLVNVLNDTFATAGFAGNNSVSASIDAGGRLSLQVAGSSGPGATPSISFGGTASDLVDTISGVTTGTALISDTSGKLLVSNANNASSAEQFGISDLAVSTGNTNTDLSIQVGTNSKVNLAITAGTYTDAAALATEVNKQIAASGAFTGVNSITASVATDADGNQGLKFISSNGQSIKLTGGLMKAAVAGVAGAAGTGGISKTDLSTDGVTFPANPAVSGGIDLSGGSTMALSVTDSSGQVTTKSLDLGLTGKNVSYSDYASALQTAANAAFGGTGISFSASAGNGKLQLTSSNPSIASYEATGAAVTSAFGSSVKGTAPQTQLDVNKFTSMSDVAKAINDDLGGAAVAKFDDTSKSWSFEVATGDNGSASSISLSGSGLSSVQMSGTLSASGQAGDATAAKLSTVNVLTTDAATAALGSIDNSIEYVSKQRSLLGAIENRLSHTVNNLTNIVTNTESSRSAIVDADYSKETTALAKNQILTQAATAMLAQANQSSQSVLSLLK